jgi:hypothetical protein
MFSRSDATLEPLSAPSVVVPTLRNMPSVRIATWNTKQGVAPRKPALELWEWVTRETNADILVLTEARITADGIPEGWEAIYTPGGLGGRRNYGTIIAARGVEIRRAEYPRIEDSEFDDDPDDPIEFPSQATTFAVEVLVEGQLELVVLGAYGLLDEYGNGMGELSKIANEYVDLVTEYGLERVVVAGDFNLWPDDLLPLLSELHLDDVTSKRKSFPRLQDPRGGSRIWTHKNGAKNTNGARQELDYIFVGSEFDGELRDIRGGVDDFPDAWEFSDHAPVAVTLVF